MWAICSFYNPARYRRRLANYRIFRQNLAIPLVTVELSFDDHFELTEGDADILIQISGGAVLWQKERLLNLAIKSVPPNVSNIAWIDCDVIFARPDWVEEANAQLDAFSVVQLFSNVVDLNQDNHQVDITYHDISPCFHGVVSSMKQRHLSAEVVFAQPRSRFAGLAWAARREILENHGLYDAMIAGGGDRAMASAMYGQLETLVKLNEFNCARREHYLKWAHPYHKAVNGSISHVAGRLYHLWHGDIHNRNYASRHRRLAECNFNPDADIVIGSNGAWQWARSRPDLEEFFAKYFAGRAEDG